MRSSILALSLLVLALPAFAQFTPPLPTPLPLRPEFPPPPPTPTPTPPPEPIRFNGVPLGEDPAEALRKAAIDAVARQEAAALRPIEEPQIAEQRAAQQRADEQRRADERLAEEKSFHGNITTAVYLGLGLAAVFAGVRLFKRK